MRRLHPTRFLVVFGGLALLVLLCAFVVARCMLVSLMDEGRTVGPEVLRIAEGIELWIPEGYEAWVRDEPYSGVDVFRSDGSLPLAVSVLVVPSQEASAVLSLLRSEVYVEPAPIGLPSGWEWGVARDSREGHDTDFLAQAITTAGGNGVVVTVHSAALEGDNDSPAAAIVRFLHE